MEQLDKHTDKQGRTWRNILADNGTEFKVRVATDNDNCEEYIGSVAMANEIMTVDCGYNTKKHADAEQIDNVICFYVTNEQLELSDERLAEVLAQDCEDVFGKAD